MSPLEQLKEAVRPYYLRWIYFRLRPGRRPDAFHNCWQYPYDKIIGDSPRLPESPASSLPDLIFYPMTDWHTRIQRTQHLVRAFAGLGHRCIYINPHLGREFETTPLRDKDHRLARLEENIYELHIRLPREPVFHDRLLSPNEEDIVLDVIRRVLPRRPCAIQILSFPLWRGVARRFRDQAAFPIVYDCHDLLAGFQNICADMITAETDLLEEADLVLFSSQGLADQYRSVKKWLLVRNGVTAMDFTGNGASREGPPVVGYVGALDSWFDLEAMEQSAALNPHCRFVLAGRIEYPPIQRLESIPNIELLGEIPYTRVPELLSQFRAALIPFRINPLTLMTNPIKLYEYFSCGLPVVSTLLPEAQAMGDLVYLGSNPADFALQVIRAVREDDPSRRSRRKEIAARENWTARARDISEEFGALLGYAKA
ncbi:MAG TPA: glycosyltransferase [Terriglobia bacterium]|nr:glycosyltransferase [Terriglobia bacterium]